MAWMPPRNLCRLNPLRTPHWRWQYAQEVVREDRHLDDHDPWIDRAVDLLRRPASDPDLAAAVYIHEHPGHVADELQARLLAHEPLPAIAEKVGPPVPVVTAYASVFCDVLDLPIGCDWALLQVLRIGDWLHRDLDEGDIWRWWGAAGDVVAVDLLVADSLGRPDPQVPNRPLLAAQARYLVREYAAGLRSPVMPLPLLEEGLSLFSHLTADHASTPLLQNMIQMIRLASSRVNRAAEDQASKTPESTRLAASAGTTPYRRRKNSQPPTAQEASVKTRQELATLFAQAASIRESWGNTQE